MKNQIIYSIILISTIILFTSCYDKDKAKTSYDRDLNMMKYKDYNSAIKDFNDAIELYPNYDEAYYQRGVAKYELN